MIPIVAAAIGPPFYRQRQPGLGRAQPGAYPSQGWSRPANAQHRNWRAFDGDGFLRQAVNGRWRFNRR
jgi:hypothetical protein